MDARGAGRQQARDDFQVPVAVAGCGGLLVICSRHTLVVDKELDTRGSLG